MWWFWFLMTLMTSSLWISVRNTRGWWSKKSFSGTCFLATERWWFWRTRIQCLGPVAHFRGNWLKSTFGSLSCGGIMMMMIMMITTNSMLITMISMLIKMTWMMTRLNIILVSLSTSTSATPIMQWWCWWWWWWWSSSSSYCQLFQRPIQLQHPGLVLCNRPRS